MGENPQRRRIIPGLSFGTAFFDPRFDPSRMVEKGQYEHHERCLEHQKTPATVEIAGVQWYARLDSNQRPSESESEGASTCNAVIAWVCGNGGQF